MTRPIAVAVTARSAAVRLPVTGALYRLPKARAWRLTPLDSGIAREGIANRAVTLFSGLTPALRYRLEVEEIDPLEFATAPCTGMVEAIDHGMVCDAEAGDLDSARKNANALAHALESTPAGGTLKLASGTWTSFPLALRSDVTLHLAAGAVLRAPSGRDGWPIVPARNAAGNMLGSWEGLPAACFAAPLYAVGAERLVIEGEGVLDGSGHLGDWWTWPKETREGARRPRGLHLINCRQVVLLGFTIRNAPSWTVHPQGCEDLTAACLAIEAPHDSPNTDGFDPEGCRNVRIEGVRFSVGDDCIAVKAGKRGPNGEADHLVETRGITVRHCLMERGHGGLVIGSEMSGGVHDITVEDCEMVGTDRGLRLKTRRGRGGAISNIAMRRVVMDGVQTALSANAHYHCDADGHEDWVQSREPAEVNAGTPSIDGIAVEDVDVFGLGHAAGVFLGLPEQPIRNVRIRSLRVHSFDDCAEAMPPIMADHVRPMRHEMIVAEQVDIECDDPALLSPGKVSCPTA